MEECLVFIRSLRPFKVKKYRLDKHPNYRYTAEADSKNLRPTPYLLEYCDEDIEEVRVKAPGEEGYIVPAVVDSARKRALEVEKRKKVMAMAEAEKEMAKSTTVESDETKTKERYAKEMEERKKGLSVKGAEAFDGCRLSDMKIVDSYDPMYEFQE